MTINPNSRPNGRRAFSLIELVIVVVIVGILAAIAIPRLSRATSGAADSSLQGSLAVMRKAIDHYSSEHGGAYPTAANFATAMTQYTDSQGTISTTPTATCIYGPYLRAIPPLPLGAAKGNSSVAAAAGAGVGWIYTAATGTITANTTTEADATGKLYSAY